MDEILKKLYVKLNFPSKNVLWKNVQEEDLKYTKKQVSDWVDKQEVQQLVGKKQKPPMYASVVAPKVGSNLMIDLMIFDRYEINSYKYILMTIDIKSRFACAIALTRRTEDVLIKAMESVFKKMKHVPEELQMDNEGAFTGAAFQNAMTKAGVKTLWFSEAGDIRKNSVVERLNRTIAERILRWREGTGRRDWPKVLDEIIQQYNETFHSTIKARPVDVWNGVDENKQTIVTVIENLKKGDKVRIKKEKKTFGKGDTIQFSREIYIIKEKQGGKYVLVDDKDVEQKRRYAGDELKLANTVEAIEIEKGEKQKMIKQVDENKKKKRVKKELTQLKLDDTLGTKLKDLPAKRLKKPKKM